jgi:hypothetical protein
MAGLNLIINSCQQKGQPAELIATRSNGPAKILEFPFHLTDYSPILSICNDLIPSEWNTRIQEFRSQEIALVKARQEYIAQCKLEYVQILKPVLETFKQENPELFI